MLWSKLYFLFSCQTDRAVQLLLETSSENAHYYCDSLKACLVTTVTSSGPSQSTIKLVATNMIANGKLAGKMGLEFSVCLSTSNSDLIKAADRDGRGESPIVIDLMSCIWYSVHLK